MKKNSNILLYYEISLCNAMMWKRKKKFFYYCPSHGWNRCTMEVITYYNILPTGYDYYYTHQTRNGKTKGKSLKFEFGFDSFVLWHVHLLWAIPMPIICITLNYIVYVISHIHYIMDLLDPYTSRIILLMLQTSTVNTVPREFIITAAMTTKLSPWYEIHFKIWFCYFN